MVEVIPAVLANSPEEFEKMIRLVAPYAARVHLDIADGIFVPNETIKGYLELDLAPADLKYDVHLMVKNPLDQLSHWDRENTDRFIVHIESEDIEKTIVELRSMGKSVGIAVNPDTSNEKVEPFLAMADFVQFMTINPGFQGREFLDHVLEKIADFRKKHPEIVIAVDGGINPVTAAIAVKAGASVLVSGSFIIKSGDAGKAINQLKSVG